MGLDRVAAVFAATLSHFSASSSSGSSVSTSTLPPLGSPFRSAWAGHGRTGGLRLSSSLQDFSTYRKVSAEETDLALGVGAGVLRSKPSPLQLLREGNLGGSSFSKEKALPSTSAKSRRWLKMAVGVLLIFILFTVVFLGFGRLRSYWSTEASQFSIVLDCGSTGTRIHVYEWVQNDGKGHEKLPMVLHPFPQSIDSKTGQQNGRAYHRMETEPGFDKLLHNESGLRAAIEPLLQWAEKQIPAHAHRNSPLFLLATAGLRRLQTTDSEWILDKAWSILEESSFMCRRSWVRPKISMKSLEAALRGDVSDKCQDALRVLDIILRQHAARKNYLLVRQSFFHWSFAPLVDLGGGVQGCKGYHVSFRTSQKGLSLNMDVSTTMLIKHGRIIDFLLANQSVDIPWKIDWLKARRVLKGVRIKALHTNMEFKILGFSEKSCKEQLFSLKVRNKDNQETESPPKTIEVTVLEYFTNTKQMRLGISADLPCVDVGRSKRPNYLPIELCEILPGQRYTKGLTTAQRSSLVEQSRQKPEERMDVLKKAMMANDYNSDPLLRACNINVDRQSMVIDGRILDPPKLKFGQGGMLDEVPQRGRWNFNNKTMVRPAEVKNWAVVNFTKCHENECRRIADDLQRCCGRKGLNIGSVGQIFCENPRDMRANPVDRVDRMLNQMKSRLSQPPDFLLCLLPERKTSDLYGPWKKKFLSEMGIVNQCIAPSKKMNDQYYTNVALKINAKVGGLNSFLSVEYNASIPGISSQPTIIIGMDVSHGSPGHGDTPSIAAVVSSREWPLISKYRASVRTQSRKVEMIEALYKPRPSEQDGKMTDTGMINELLIDFYKTCKPSSSGRKPLQMIIFRDGVSESQFDQVLNVELQAILKACDHIENGYRPKVTLIIAQKNHHTKLFQTNASGNVQAGNVLPGTIVDTQICHPRNFDFFLCPQNGPIGTSRPTHYHVLLDENKFGVDDIQILVHALSYVYQRSTTAISAVAPINYAHLAATQMQQFLKAEDLSESASRSGRGEGSVASGGGNIPELPKLHRNVCDSMFFC